MDSWTFCLAACNPLRRVPFGEPGSSDATQAKLLVVWLLLRQDGQTPEVVPIRLLQGRGRGQFGWGIEEGRSVVQMLSFPWLLAHFGSGCQNVCRVFNKMSLLPSFRKLLRKIPDSLFIQNL